MRKLGSFSLSAAIMPFILTSILSSELKSVELKEDFHIFRNALMEGHADLYRYTSQADLEEQFKNVEQTLIGPKDLYEFYRSLAFLIAQIKCGHTEILLPSEIQKKISTITPLLPFRFRVLNSQLYVFRDLSSDKDGLAGWEILSINGIPSSKILATFRKLTPGDGDIETGRTWTLNNDWYMNRYAEPFLGIESPFHIVVQHPGSHSTRTVFVKGIRLPEINRRWHEGFPGDQLPENSADLSFSKDRKIAILRVRSFEGDADSTKTKLDEFFRQAFEGIRENGTDQLILDLRNNPGGQDDFGSDLVSYLLQKPFQYYEDIRMRALHFQFEKYTSQPLEYPPNLMTRGSDGWFHATGHPSWGVQANKEPGFGGKLFVLMNGGSFSTTSEAIAQLHFHRRAIFIGEETGGAYYGNNSGFMPMVILPHSKIQLMLPVTAYYTAVKGNSNRSRGVFPDYAIEYTIQDLLDGKDKEMELAMHLASK